MAYKGPQVVIGPSSSTDNTIPRFDLTSGALIQGSSVVISDADAVSGVTQLDVDNIRVDGNTISSTDTNGNVVLAPDGSGTVSVTAAPIVPSTNRADSLGSASNSWDNVYADGLTFDGGTNILNSYTALTTWTPTLAFGGSSTGITYSAMEGTYVRIGPLAIVGIFLALTNKGTSTGAATITGFPLSSYATQTQYLNIDNWNQINFDTNYTQAAMEITVSSSTFSLIQTGDNSAFIALDDTNFANGSRIFCNITMWVT